MASFATIETGEDVNSVLFGAGQKAKKEAKEAKKALKAAAEDEPAGQTAEESEEAIKAAEKAARKAEKKRLKALAKGEATESASSLKPSSVQASAEPTADQATAAKKPKKQATGENRWTRYTSDICLILSPGKKQFWHAFFCAASSLVSNPDRSSNLKSSSQLLG